MSTKPRTRNIPTWRMTSEELARTWAAHHGITGKAGWLHTTDGKAICQGWTALTDILERHRVIVPGVGVDWRRADLARVTPARLARDHRAR